MANHISPSAANAKAGAAAPQCTPQYKRVLIKVSGEALMGNQPYGQDHPTLLKICNDIKDTIAMGVEVCVVVGGGNIFRGMSGEATGIERASADYMGMLATVMNALALQNTMERMNMDSRVLSAISMMQICEPYIRRRALRHLEQGRVVIFAAGTGNPFFTTDTAGTLRAIEMGCDAILKATQVDGIYSADPKTNPDAKRYQSLTYQQVLVDDLKVMDASAISLAKENNIPIVVFSIHNEGAIQGAVCGQGKFTLIKNQPNSSYP